MVRWIVLGMLMGCASDPTQVIIVVDTDLSIPNELDSVAITVVGPDGEMQSARGPLDADEPRTLAQTHTGGPLGPFDATVEGRLGEDVVVSRRAIFEFQRGRRLTLTMHLARSCIGASCPEATCDETGCRPITVSAAELTPWDGPPRLDSNNDGGLDDAGVDDAALDAGEDDGCVAVEEVCDDRDQDCDGRVDETFNFETDPTNCGGCGVTCSFPGGIPSCQAGDCVMAGCEEGLADCDGDGESCEIDTMTNEDFCGNCTTECRPPDRDCCDGVCDRC